MFEHAALFMECPKLIKQRERFKATLPPFIVPEELLGVPYISMTKRRECTLPGKRKGNDPFSTPR